MGDAAVFWAAEDAAGVQAPVASVQGQESVVMDWYSHWAREWENPPEEREEEEYPGPFAEGEDW